MEEYTQITLDQWMQWKEDIRKKLEETANNFVYIGYRLKQIRDSGMFGGAADVFEFAQNEYGLTKSTVSRFIAINEKYSEGGNSLELREEFRNFSYSKLSEMLTLPDREIELINEKTTIRAIRELKKFGTEDPEKVLDAEDLGERAWTPLEKCVIDFFKDKRDVLEQVMGLLEQEDPDYRQAAELMAPSGQAFHKKGIVFLFFYEWNEGVKYKLMTSPDPVHMDWPDFLNMVYVIYSGCTPGRVAAEFYGEQEKTVEAQENLKPEAVATSQQKEDKPEGEEPEKEAIPKRDEAGEGREEPGQEAAGQEPETEERQQAEEAEKGAAEDIQEAEPEQEPPKAEQEPPKEEQEEQSQADADEEEGEAAEEKALWKGQAEKVRGEIIRKMTTIQTDISFAGTDIGKWMKIKMGLAAATGLVNDMIRCIKMEDIDGQMEMKDYLGDA